MSLSLIINPVSYNSTIAIVELEKEMETVDIRHSVRKLQNHEKSISSVTTDELYLSETVFDKETDVSDLSEFIAHALTAPASDKSEKSVSLSFRFIS